MYVVIAVATFVGLGFATGRLPTDPIAHSGPEAFAPSPPSEMGTPRPEGPPVSAKPPGAIPPSMLKNLPVAEPGENHESDDGKDDGEDEGKDEGDDEEKDDDEEKGRGEEKGKGHDKDHPGKGNEKGEDDKGDE